jgi:succinoglycan biosynthesis transport protein ExoP
MELQTYLTILIRRWRIVLLVFLVISSVFAYGSNYIPPSYQAETSLRVFTPLAGSLSYPYHEDYFALRLMNTYAQIAKSEQVMNELKEKMSLETLPDISVKIIPESEIIQFIVQSSDPALAAQVANGLAEVVISKQDQGMESNTSSEEPNVLTDRLNELENKIAQSTQEHDRLVQTYSQTKAQIAILDQKIRMKEASYQSLLNQRRQGEMESLVKDLEVLNQQYEKLTTDSYAYLSQISMIEQNIQNDQRVYSDLLTQYDNVLGTEYRQGRTQNILIISPAVEPSISTSPGRWFFVGLGIICGLIGGIILAFVIDSLDTRIFTSDQISRITAIPVLSRFPKIKGLKDRNTPLNSESLAFNTDYWLACTRILAILQHGSVKTILVTSPNPMEGKSTFISTIATGLAQNNCKVLIVDADLRRPQQKKTYQISGGQDLSSFLSDENSKIEDVIQRNVKQGIDLLPNLTECNDPMEMLKSPRLGVLLEKVRKYDIILFDSPALLATPDAYNLAKVVDGVVVIAKWGSTTDDDIRSICNHLEGIGSKILGIVLSQVPVKREQNYYHHREID